MFKTTLALALTVFAFSAQAEVNIEDCKNNSIDLTSAVEMRSFGKGSINVFKTDLIEPAAASMGLAVVVHRGDSLENYESFCQHISGLSDLDLKSAKSAYDAKTNTLTLVMKVHQMDSEGEFPERTLTATISKGAKERDLVRASVR